MGVSRALVQLQQRDHRTVEERAVLEGLEQLGIPAKTFYRKQFQRRQLALAPDTLVAGEVDIVRSCLQLLDIEPPLLPSYPTSLRPFLNRPVSEASLAEVERGDAGLPVFVKPACADKRFTGFVFDGIDKRGFRGAGRQLRVHCSPVVEFVAEFRAYVVGGVARSVCQYEGAPIDPPPASFVRELLGAMEAADELPAGFALDLGLLARGPWSLVECNEGFGLGLYEGLEARDYVDLLIARWEQLV